MENIYEFIRESMRVVIVVDCENSECIQAVWSIKKLKF